MEHQPAKKRRGPKSRAGKILLNLVITAIVGFVYFYVALPALNFQSGELYTFLAVLCVVYVICALISSGFNLEGGSPAEYLRFIKTQCLPVGILFLAIIAVGLVGQLTSLTIFRAAAYRDLLEVETGDFATDVAEIPFSEIPMLDEASARRLGTTQMGTMPDMVSQFEVAYDYTQINYQGHPVRVACLEYADLIKWFTNRSNGLPAYILVDMVTQEVEVVRLPEGEGIKYSPSEPLNRNISRHLRFQYPTFMFSQPTFEIDEEGHPWWICPRIIKTIGLFGGTDIHGAVLVDAVTGESQYYEEVPSWVDRVYLASLIAQQYDYHGTLVNGWFNSVFGQRGVTVTTADYNYIAMNDDVYMYTGVTSVSSDQSNLGFLLSNQRTKQTKFYSAPGATEQAAMSSAQGAVQDLRYQATFPLLLNIAGQPTYFMALKDANELVKQYAMVNVSQYSTIVSTAATVSACEQEYLRLLAEKGVTSTEELPATEISGVIDDIRSAVLEGNTYYFLRLEWEDAYYSLSAAQNPIAVILNVGDEVTIHHAPAAEGDTSAILTGESVTLNRAAQPAPSQAPAQTPAAQPEESPAA